MKYLMYEFGIALDINYKYTWICKKKKIIIIKKKKKPNSQFSILIYKAQLTILIKEELNV